MLAERGLVISAGKMSGLWSGEPASIELDDLDVICAVLDCSVDEILLTEPDKVQPVSDRNGDEAKAVGANSPGSVTPKRRDGRSLPPA